MFDEMCELVREEISHRIQSIYVSKFYEGIGTSFWDFVHKLFEKTIIWYLYYRTNISTSVHYILYILMVHYPHNGFGHFSLMLLPFI